MHRLDLGVPVSNAPLATRYDARKVHVAVAVVRLHLSPGQVLPIQWISGMQIDRAVSALAELGVDRRGEIERDLSRLVAFERPDHVPLAQEFAGGVVLGVVPALAQHFRVDRTEMFAA